MTGEECSLYIHVPFCTKKCPYCHFFVQQDSLDGQNVFLTALHQQWQQQKHLLQGKRLVSVYFGGGTPSLLAAKEIQSLLEAISPSSSCEITLEVNPEKVTRQQMQDFHSAGINRASIGIQSFDPALLQLLGRTHSAIQAEKAIHTIYDAGITNLSIDLLYEIPKQTLQTWDHTLQVASTLPICHVSLYNLVFEEATPFYRQKHLLLPHLPSDEDSLTMLHTAVAFLTKLGMHRYEISAFARLGYESIHNTGYWIGRPFLGLGPSAFSYIEGRRYRNSMNLQKWARQITEGENCEDFSETLSEEKKQRELLAIALRRIEGIDLTTWSLSPSAQADLQELIHKGLLWQEGTRVRLSEKGMDFYDTIAAELV